MGRILLPEAAVSQAVQPDSGSSAFRFQRRYGQSLQFPSAQIQTGNVIHAENHAGGRHLFPVQGHFPAARSHQEKQSHHGKRQANAPGHPLFKNFGGVIRVVHRLDGIVLFPGIRLPRSAPTLAGGGHQTVIRQNVRPRHRVPIHAGRNFVALRKIHSARQNNALPVLRGRPFPAHLTVKHGSSVHERLVHEKLQVFLRVSGGSIIIKIHSEPQKHESHDNRPAGKPHGRLTFYRVRLHASYIPANPCP